MIAIVVTILICGTAVYLAKLFLPLMQRQADVKANAPAKPIAIPSDLVSYATTWVDPWARSENLKVIQELYEETGSWDAVRRAISQTQSQ